MSERHGRGKKDGKKEPPDKSAERRCSVSRVASQKDPSNHPPRRSPSREERSARPGRRHRYQPSDEQFEVARAQKEANARVMAQRRVEEAKEERERRERRAAREVEKVFKDMATGLAMPAESSQKTSSSAKMTKKTKKSAPGAPMEVNSTPLPIPPLPASATRSMETSERSPERETVTSSAIPLRRVVRQKVVVIGDGESDDAEKGSPTRDVPLPTSPPSRKIPASAAQVKLDASRPLRDEAVLEHDFNIQEKKIELKMPYDPMNDPINEDDWVVEKLMRRVYNKEAFTEVAPVDRQVVQNVTNERQLRRLPFLGYAFYEEEWDIGAMVDWLASDEKFMKDYRKNKSKPITLCPEWLSAMKVGAGLSRLVIDAYTMRMWGRPSSIDGWDKDHPASFLPLMITSLLVSKFVVCIPIYQRVFDRAPDGTLRELPFKQWSDGQRNDGYHKPYDTSVTRRLIGFMWTGMGGAVTFYPTEGFDQEMNNKEACALLLGVGFPHDKVLVTPGDEDEDELFKLNMNKTLTNNRILASGFLASIVRNTSDVPLMAAIVNTVFLGGNEVQRWHTAPAPNFSDGFFDRTMDNKKRAHVIRATAIYAQVLHDTIFSTHYAYAVQRHVLGGDWPESESGLRRHVDNWLRRMEDEQFHRFPMSAGLPTAPMHYNSKRPSGFVRMRALIDFYKGQLRDKKWKASGRPSDEGITLEQRASGLRNMQELVREWAKTVAREPEHTFGKQSEIIAMARLWQQDIGIEKVTLDKSRLDEVFNFNTLTLDGNGPKGRAQASVFPLFLRRLVESGKFAETVEGTMCHIMTEHRSLRVFGVLLKRSMINVPVPDEVGGPVEEYMAHGRFHRNPATPPLIHPEWRWTVEHMKTEAPFSKKVAMTLFMERFTAVPASGLAYPGHVAMEPMVPLDEAVERFNKMKHDPRVSNSSPFNMGELRYDLRTRMLPGNLAPFYADIVPEEFDFMTQALPILAGFPIYPGDATDSSPFDGKFLTVPGFVCAPVSKPLTWAEQIIFEYLHWGAADERTRAKEGATVDQLNPLIGARLSNEFMCAGAQQVRIEWMEMAEQGNSYASVHHTNNRLFTSDSFNGMLVHKMLTHLLRWHHIESWSAPVMEYADLIKWMRFRAEKFRELVLEEVMASGRTIGDFASLEHMTEENVRRLVITPAAHKRLTDPKLFAPYGDGFDTNDAQKNAFRKTLAELSGVSRRVESMASGLEVALRVCNDYRLYFARVRREAVVKAQQIAVTDVGEDYAPTSDGVRRLVARAFRNAGTHATRSSLELNPGELQVLPLTSIVRRDPLVIERALVAGLHGHVVDRETAETLFSWLFTITGYARHEWHSWAAGLIERVFNEYGRGDRQEPDVYALFQLPGYDITQARREGHAPVSYPRGKLTAYASVSIATRLDQRQANFVRMGQWGPTIDSSFGESFWRAPNRPYLASGPLLAETYKDLNSTPLPEPVRPFYAAISNVEPSRSRLGSSGRGRGNSRAGMASSRSSTRMMDARQQASGASVMASAAPSSSVQSGSQKWMGPGQGIAPLASVKFAPASDFDMERWRLMGTAFPQSMLVDEKHKEPREASERQSSSRRHPSRSPSCSMGSPSAKRQSKEREQDEESMETASQPHPSPMEQAVESSAGSVSEEDGEENFDDMLS